jgi:hypothetical protein
MTSPWEAGPAAAGESYPHNAVTLIDGSSFCISDSIGYVTPGRAHGVFVRDTSVLSRWELTFDGATRFR